MGLQILENLRKQATEALATLLSYQQLSGWTPEQVGEQLDVLVQQAFYLTKAIGHPWGGGDPAPHIGVAVVDVDNEKLLYAWPSVAEIVVNTCAAEKLQQAYATGKKDLAKYLAYKGENDVIYVSPGRTLTGILEEIHAEEQNRNKS